MNLNSRFSLKSVLEKTVPFFLVRLKLKIIFLLFLSCSQFYISVLICVVCLFGIFIFFRIHAKF